MSGHLTPWQGKVMDILGRPESERVTVAEMAEELGVSRQSLIAVVSSLYEASLVVRERGGGTNRYRLSSHGHAIQANRESSRRWNTMRGGN